jgi:hypothetical protein
MMEIPEQKAPSIFWKALLFLFSEILLSHYRPKLIPVHQHSSLVAIGAELAGDHLHGHTDFNRLITQVRQLRRYQGTLLQADQGHRIGGTLIKTGGGIRHSCVGIDFTLPAEHVLVAGFATAVRANIAWWEQLGVAVGTNLPYQGIALLFQSPMARYFHKNISSNKV